MVSNIEDDYDLTPEIQTAFTDARYNFNNIIMDDEKVLTFHKILESVDYDRRETLYQNGINLLDVISETE